MNAKTVIQILMIGLLLSSNVHAFFPDGVPSSVSRDFIKVKADELEKRYSESYKELERAKSRKKEAFEAYDEGCSVHLGDIFRVGGSSIVLSVGTLFSMIGETLIIRNTSAEVDGTLGDRYQRTKFMASELKKLVSEPMHTLSMEQCSEIKEAIKSSIKEEKKTLGQVQKIDELRKQVVAISQLPREAINDDYVRNLGLNDSKFNSSSDRDVAQSR